MGQWWPHPNRECSQWEYIPLSAFQSREEAAAEQGSKSYRGRRSLIGMNSAWGAGSGAGTELGPNQQPQSSSSVSIFIYI